jgi:hypothetical protein
MGKTKTKRGFPLVEFEDFYGAKCSLQKSSLATEECIWFGVNDAEPKIMASHAEKLGIKTKKLTGWIEYPIHEDVNLNTRMHLSREQAKNLLPHLMRFIAIGEICL